MSGTEADPSGRAPHEGGAKLDAGKIRAALVCGGFARALRAVAEVGTFGARKYTAHGWVHVPDGIERYSDALLRHLLAEWTGEATDAQSGLRHAAHAAWNALARLDLMLREAEGRNGSELVEDQAGVPKEPITRRWVREQIQAQAMERERALAEVADAGQA